MGALHEIWGYGAVGLSGLAGLVALGLAAARRPLPRAFWWPAGAAMGGMAGQVVLGVLLYQQGERPGSQHVFYGFVVLFTLAFAYIYRAQLSARPALRWGLLLLFVMGLGVRGIMTFGGDF